ncbi:LuxR C-terminal-related transcriptional regulator [Cloacibacillus evryensis]|uniref:LuxR C-terminal-related transcriptional regulator n=1 Tax=Cloacibacillus evryensis TaxID=508460 RepID=A0AAW5K3E9_9BACT|nr:LuxR C-terminal-related transcriptional regulator [Cloacibacillus evryensis]EHL65248.1 hypothetical protein HMPREF1006_00261 [Synergistes sp. 3_1_syn1]MCQ4814344.1 LuxR C-terminal-related transcriptional regulator [Cloacibacillus evryensis]
METLLRLAREKRGDEEKEAMDGLLELCSRMRAGMAKIKESVRSISASLTRRERQISLLIKQGLTTKQIAELLGISDGTVRVVRQPQRIPTAYCIYFT